MPPLSLGTSGEAAPPEPPHLPPWHQFFDTHSFSIPMSFLDATTRVHKNLTHFHLNYLCLTLITFALTLLPLLIFREIPLILSMLAIHAPMLCAIPYMDRRISSRQFQVFKFAFVMKRHFYLILVFVTTVLPFVLAQAWIDLVVFLVSSATIVGLHGVFMVPVLEEDVPSQPLLEAQVAV